MNTKIFILVIGLLVSSSVNAGTCREYSNILSTAYGLYLDNEQFKSQEYLISQGVLRNVAIMLPYDTNGFPSMKYRGYDKRHSNKIFKFICENGFAMVLNHQSFTVEDMFIN